MGGRRRATTVQHPAWDALRRGRTLPVSVHPSELPGTWRRLGEAEPHGQIEDWACSMPDGSRLHVHVFPDGRMSVHRDRWDPDRSALHRAFHVALETTAGRLGLAITAARVLGWLP